MPVKTASFFKRSALPALAVFFSSILVTSMFWAVAPTKFEGEEGSDYLAFYRPVAVQITEGRGITIPDGNPAIRYPPGFSLMLSGLFRLSNAFGISEVRLLAAFTLLCMAVTSVLVFSIAGSVWSTLPSLLAAFAWMTYPLMLWITRGPASEVPFVLLVYTAFFLFWNSLSKNRQSFLNYFLAGLAIGSAMLVRPAAIGIGLLMGLILWFGKREFSARLRLTLVATLLLGNLIVVLPWEAFVYSRTGRIVILSSGGVPSVRDGLTYAVNLKGFREGSAVPTGVKLLMEDIQSHYEELRSLSDIGSIMGREFVAHPVAVVELLGLKIARSWYGTDSQRMEFPILMVQLFYLLFVVLSTRAAWKQGGHPRLLAVTVWFIVLYFWGMTALVLSIARYMIPGMGLLFVLLPALVPANRNRIASA